MRPRTFPSRCRVWRNAGGPPAAPDLDNQPCELQQSRTTTPIGNAIPTQYASRYINFPAGSDVRTASAGMMGDTIRLPSVGGFDYRVIDVQDVYRDRVGGFRRCLCELIAATYPAP